MCKGSCGFEKKEVGWKRRENNLDSPGEVCESRRSDHDDDKLWICQQGFKKE
jgi:hypothetical protein